MNLVTVTPARVAFVRSIRQLLADQSVSIRALAADTPALRDATRAVSDEFISGTLLNERLPYSVPVEAVVAWSRKLGPAVWRAWFASQGLPFDAIPVSAAETAVVDIIGAAASAVRESGEAFSASMTALADGKVTLAEKRLARREIGQAVESLHALGAAVEAA